MIRKIFYLVPLLLAVLFGYWMGEGPKPKKEPASKKTFHPEKDFPLGDEKSLAVIVYAYKNEKVCERTLKSIFEQDYDRFRIIFFDDASEDGTFEKVRSFILENNQEHRVILIQNQERLGPVGCLYRAAATLQDQEIAIPLDVKDWLAHPRVLSRLNAVYQNPDVWLTAFGPILYPSYEKWNCPSNPENRPSFMPVSFYAALFKQIRLVDLVKEGRFSMGRESYLSPLFQMAKERCRVLNEPLIIVNLARCSREAVVQPLFAYSPLTAFPSQPKGEDKADIILFSCDRPLQLFACLESIHRYISGFEQIFVLTRSSDERFLMGYRKVAQAFPDVRFIFQGKEFKKDFKPLLLATLFESPHPYVMFGTDDEIVKDFTDLNSCMEMMSKTGAYGFYLRLGTHITYSYQLNRDQPVPPSIDLGNGIKAWNLKAGHFDWEFPHTLDMTLYRKSILKIPFEKMRYKTPNSLEFCWAKEYHSEQEIGLYFDRSKVVNIPLNVVGRTGNPHMNFLTAPELLAKFDQGLKIDISPLFRIDNSSPHFEYYPEFVLR